jgi:hypothetical protein
MTLDRRTAMKWVLAAGAAAQLPDFSIAAAPAGSPQGYGKDPDLLKRYTAGNGWPLTLNEAQRRTTRALCDLIIPADEHSPAASAVATHEFIDEWISAPYPDCRRDREMIVHGLDWLDQESHRRYRRDFASAGAGQMSALCDEIADAVKAAPDRAQAAAFFKRYRELTAIGYYTTPVGMKDLRYVGNEPLVTFNGPPPEVLKRLGLA